MTDHHTGTYKSLEDWEDSNLPIILNPGDIDRRGRCMHGKVDCKHCSPFTCVSCEMPCSRKDRNGQATCEVCEWQSEHII